MQSSDQERPIRASGRYDQTLKWMLTQAHDGFLALIAPGLKWQAEHSPEIPAVARLADLVWEVEQRGGKRGLLHVELQLEVEDDIGERLAEYAIRLWRRDHLPVRSVAVFLRKSRTTPASPFVIAWEQQESLRYSFDVVRLWEIPQDRVLATPEYTLWPLASLMAGVTAATTVRVAERLATAPAPRQERSDLIGLLVGLAATPSSRRMLLDQLRRNPMIDELLRESGIAQEFIDQGREQGRLEGEREFVLVALEGRFGPLSEDVRAAVSAAGEAALCEVAARLAIDSLEQVCARLGLA